MRHTILVLFTLGVLVSIATVHAQSQSDEKLIRGYASQMKSVDEDTRISAIVGLRKIGAANRQVEELLTLALSDKSAYVRVLAAESLSKQKKQGSLAIPVLIKALESPSDPANKTGQYAKDWKRVAGGALGNYGRQAEPAIPVLVKALANSDYNVRGYAAMSLGRIGVANQMAIQGLKQAIAVEESDSVKEIMIEYLGKLTNKQ